LDGLNSSTDRFLEHALIFALIRIGDRPNTLKGLAMAGSPAKRGALIALDQMDAGQLTPEVVTPFLEPTDPLMHETALWVIAHHGEWGRAMLDFFREWLARGDMDRARRDELQRQLLAFARDAAVQELIATALADSHTRLETRLVLLEVMAQAPIARLPTAWAGQLRQALEHDNEQVVRQAVATLRAIPLDKRPLVSRVDAQINFEVTDQRFAGTRLSENFCVRWMGTIRCPKDSTYIFYTESDDGSQLFVDGKMVVDNGGSHGMRERQGRLKLAAGDHDLRIEFIQGEGQAGCKMAWAFDGRAKEIIPADALGHRPRSRTGGTAELQPGDLPRPGGQRV
jgi:PA14 domain